MKRFLSVLSLAALVGCSAPAAMTPVVQPVAPAPVASVPPQPVTVAHGAWSVTLPAGWKVDDRPQVEGEMTQVLKAGSPYNVGRGPILFSINTTPFKGPELAFAMMTSAMADQFAPDGKLLKTGIVEVDGRPGSLSILVTKHAIGLSVVSVAAGGTGYVMTCGGDVLTDSSRVAETCVAVMKTFHVK